ncbi:aromatic ring-hydroxylating oxygenase subunit alpha [Acuticoccus mangrovi]|uniref:Aromatic ring-hydroxylating dioxygenase subunit alpha n=1 Tax=Acuticoccus mangrovi TaxID=2796142 RepID=A0A934MDE4_9HYPH|nr:aromatic ring-hydroxylating dioxygenase subunit alpha [Acuticoccus mangrovi]MBJ3776262.1 aromatic ring-hydroxylating dioxygenase subunit alpha [Acuticoccus mangrovi]
MLDRQTTHALRAEPQESYTDPALLEREQTHVFDRDWVMVTRAGALPNPGDYVTAKLGRRPIVVIRQEDGSIRAFANYCLHRYAKLLDGSGNKKRIVCPYHAWTYTMAGELMGVADREGFCALKTREMGLEELACEVALGFVFVSRRFDLPAPGARLGELAALLANHRIEDYEDRIVVDEEIWEGNWKALFENFIESYHVTYSHKGSIGPTNPTKLAEKGPTGHDFFSLHHNSYRPEDYPPIHNAALTADQRRQFHVIALYPNGLAAVDPNFMWWIALEPMAPGRTNARWGLSFSPHAMAGMEDPEAYVEAIRQTIVVATAEDKEMVGRVQEGAAFGSSERGYLHDWMEVYLAEFRQYIDGLCAAD